ncbi:MAG: ribonuclease H family protein [Saprospiraceae bacterium]|nr:ribonuclease H family protein [Saprospiraceae bacterium]
MKKKFYVVWNGHVPGVYDSWDECKSQIDGFAKAKYKSYDSQREANEAFKNGSAPTFRAVQKSKTSRNDIIWDSISVDAACSGNPGVMEYQGVNTKTKAVLFHENNFPVGTNNIGEFLAIVHALALLQKKGYHDTPIYSDSKTAMGWVAKKKANTKLVEIEATKHLHELIARAESWLKKNSYKNPIIKWETENWGEIPADFGRK